jgi:arylsulfatase A-like enzyme
LSSLLAGNLDSHHPQTFLMHFPHPHNSSYFTMYRSGDWKMVYDYHPGQEGPPQHLLFNLKEDPFENNNLASKNPEKLKSMIKSMKKELESEHALYPELPSGKIVKPLTL